MGLRLPASKCQICTEICSVYLKNSYEPFIFRDQACFWWSLGGYWTTTKYIIPNKNYQSS